MGSGTTTLERETVEDTQIKGTQEEFVDQDVSRESDAPEYGRSSGQGPDWDESRHESDAPLGSMKTGEALLGQTSYGTKDEPSFADQDIDQVGDVKLIDEDKTDEI